MTSYPVYLAHLDGPFLCDMAVPFAEWAAYRNKHDATWQVAYIAAGQPLHMRLDSPQPLEQYFGFNYSNNWCDGPYIKIPISLTLPAYNRGTIWGHLSFDVSGDFTGTPALGWGVQARAFQDPPTENATSDVGMWSTTMVKGEKLHFDNVIEVVDFSQAGGVEFTVWFRQFCGSANKYEYWIPDYVDLGPAGTFTISNVKLWLQIIPRNGPLFHDESTHTFMSLLAEENPYFEISRGQILIQDSDGWVPIMSTPVNPINGSKLANSVPCKLFGHQTMTVRADRPYTPGTWFEQRLLVDGKLANDTAHWIEIVQAAAGCHEREWAVNLEPGEHIVSVECKVRNGSVEFANCIAAGVGGAAEIVWPTPGHPRIGPRS